MGDVVERRTGKAIDMENERQYAYSEAYVLINTIEKYHDRTGHYPERVLVDQIYRNRKNRSFCKEHGIRISGPALGRPRQESYEERKRAYLDNTDRIEVERGFSLAKRCYGMGLIRTKLDTTTSASIALSIIAMNINHLAECFLRCIIISNFSRYRWQKNCRKAQYSHANFNRLLVEHTLFIAERPIR